MATAVATVEAGKASGQKKIVAAKKQVIITLVIIILVRIILVKIILVGINST